MCKSCARQELHVLGKFGIFRIFGITGWVSLQWCAGDGSMTFTCCSAMREQTRQATFWSSDLVPDGFTLCQTLEALGRAGASARARQQVLATAEGRCRQRLVEGVGRYGAAWGEHVLTVGTLRCLGSRRGMEPAIENLAFPRRVVRPLLGCLRAVCQEPSSFAPQLRGVSDLGPLMCADVLEILGARESLASRCKIRVHCSKYALPLWSVGL